MIRVRAPSRLHFGLLDPVGRGERRFGGVGLMIQSPGIELSVEAASQWLFEGPLAERAETLARTLVGKASVSPQNVRILAAAPEHAGFGLGTQLAVAIALALEEACGLRRPGLGVLARRAARGQRSAIGLYGSRLGGFLVDGGKLPHETLAPLVARLPFPETWRVVLLPGEGSGLHGSLETAAFARLPNEPAHEVGERCRLVLMELLPALDRADFAAFCEGLYQYNRRAGEAFREVQAGPYAGPDVAEKVAWLRGLGVRGAGQSSWGPTVFALTPDHAEARWLAERAQERFELQANQFIITQADNHGARVWKD